jgi:23S rRNA (cytosine1962-C5)-methyltransferase
VSESGWRERVWADFREACILHEDDALLAIDKPAGVPSQAADPTRPDDVVTRLRRFLVARGKDDYLGTHQRLDRDTSGVLVMTRRRDVNAHVASEFEGRKVEKAYLACVSGWPKGKERAVLKDVLVPGDDGTMTVVRGGGGGGARGRPGVPSPRG